MAAIYYLKLREVIKDNDYLFINTFGVCIHIYTKYRFDSVLNSLLLVAFGFQCKIDKTFSMFINK